MYSRPMVGLTIVMLKPIVGWIFRKADYDSFGF